MSAHIYIFSVRLPSCGLYVVFVRGSRFVGSAASDLATFVGLPFVNQIPRLRPRPSRHLRLLWSSGSACNP
jgi:hypothetical protein